MMKKLMTLGAVALAFSATPALADHHEGGEGPGGDKGKMFEMHDTNGDGVISKDEFLAKVEERFGKMDADGNGEITKEEAQAAHEAMREKWKERREKAAAEGAVEEAPEGEAPAE